MSLDLDLLDMRVPSRFEAMAARIDALAAHGSATPQSGAAELLLLGEEALEAWVIARGETPTAQTREGFRLLALHHQGARGAPGFNACHETCREVVYHHNLIVTQSPDVAHKTLRLMAMVTKHLVLFVTGRMQVEGLGDFCCAAKPPSADGA
jgi:hypothetical protein